MRISRSTHAAAADRAHPSGGSVESIDALAVRLQGLGRDRLEETSPNGSVLQRQNAEIYGKLAKRYREVGAISEAMLSERAAKDFRDTARAFEESDDWERPRTDAEAREGLEKTIHLYSAVNLAKHDLMQLPKQKLIDALESACALRTTYRILPEHSESRMHKRIDELLLPALGNQRLNELRVHMQVPMPSRFDAYENSIAESMVSRTVLALMQTPSYQAYSAWKNAMLRRERSAIHNVRNYETPERLTALLRTLGECEIEAGAQPSTYLRLLAQIEDQVAPPDDREILAMFASPATAAAPKKPIRSRKARPEELPEPPSLLDESILQALQSRRASARFEGSVADMIRGQLLDFAEIEKMNTILRDASGRILTELDIEMNHAIVECTLNDHGKMKQISDRAYNRNNINPLRKPVVLFAPNYREAEKNALLQSLGSARNAAPVYFAATKDELCTHLEAVNLRAFAAAAHAAGFVAS